VLARLRDAGLKVNAAKSFFCTHEIEYLGYILTREGIKPQNKKVQAILTLNPPNSVKELRHFLGMVQYCRDMWVKRSEMLVACCKSNDETTKARRYRFFEAERGKETCLLPGTKENPIVQVDGGRNYYPTSFKFASLAPPPSKNHEKILPGTSLFHPEASVNKPNQVKPTLLSLLFWNGLSGVSCFHLLGDQ